MWHIKGKAGGCCTAVGGVNGKGVGIWAGIVDRDGIAIGISLHRRGNVVGKTTIGIYLKRSRAIANGIAKIEINVAEQRLCAKPRAVGTGAIKTKPRRSTII